MSDDKFRRSDYYPDEPEGDIRECAICGESGDPTCMLFIGKSGDGQDLFACGKCCSCKDSED